MQGMRRDLRCPPLQSIDGEILLKGLLAHQGRLAYLPRLRRLFPARVRGASNLLQQKLLVAPDRAGEPCMARRYH